nr:hypothetical protein [Micromonospora sp. DSM 115978]
MAGIADDLNEIVAIATSPDGRIEGRVESLKYITLRFLHDSYERYYRLHGAELLAHQLGRGATLMAAAYQKARREVMYAHGFERYSTMRPPYSSRHREYLESGAKLTAQGSSPDREIQVTTVGLIDFRVKIGPEVLYHHDQQKFLQLANEAMKDLRQEYRRVHTELRHDLYQKYKDRER